MNMNNSGSNVVSTDAPIPLRILVKGDRPSVQATIDQLCVLGFCDRAKWSPILKHVEEDRTYISILTR